MGFRAVVLGASGYAGSEVIRLLDRHPSLDLAAAAAHLQVGRTIGVESANSPNVRNTFVGLEEALDIPCDILFASLPHTASMKVLAGYEGARVVDLGGDFRLRSASLYERWYGTEHAKPEVLSRWTYGLTELNRDQIAAAKRVANPGCYATAALMVLAPCLAAGVIDPSGIHIDAKSGVSGAGRAGGEGFDFSSVNESIRPYAVTGHKHIAEIEQELGKAAGAEVKVSFVPHLVPMSRGLLVSCLALPVGSTVEKDLTDILADAYREEPFVRVLAPPELPETKRLTGTNLAELAIRTDERSGRVLGFCAIDNLGKGAAGQAIQNANLMLGLPEVAGLEAMSWVP
jgi:N-acetyl-gamma-glutamyl-phosphate reductase